jgi:hypothetical protein
MPYSMLACESNGAGVCVATQCVLPCGMSDFIWQSYGLGSGVYVGVGSVGPTRQQGQ